MTYLEYKRLDESFKSVLRQVNSLGIDHPVITKSLLNLSMLRHQLKNIPIIK